uniref:Uncharacterized protein n=1 Tax=Arundo donax TaxID=35708 RepID=A0A0A9FV99_ARUDO
MDAAPATGRRGRAWKPRRGRPLPWPTGGRTKTVTHVSRDGHHHVGAATSAERRS